MRIFAVSDIHVDHEVNARWFNGLSEADFTSDYLILAGDISHVLAELEAVFDRASRKFARVFYVPGNHDLWLRNETQFASSLDKFDAVLDLADDVGISTEAHHEDGLSIMPLFGWYDYSFGAPGNILKSAWSDYRLCKWPQGHDDASVTRRFLAMNEPLPDMPAGNKIISFSHFLPRIDVMPRRIPPHRRFVYPVLGSDSIDAQIRRLSSRIHVYGHSHVNRNVTIDGVTYINNAYGYPKETRISAKRLVVIHSDQD